MIATSERTYQQSRSRATILLTLLGFVWLGIGCSGDDSPRLVPVSGHVTVDGKPLTSGTVTLRPDKSQGNTYGGEPLGDINEQGEYTILTRGKPGAPLGKYKVTVTSSGPITSDNTKANPKNLLNMTYFHADITPLAVEVVKEPAAGAYDLKLRP